MPKKQPKFLIQLNFMDYFKKTVEILNNNGL